MGDESQTPKFKVTDRPGLCQAAKNEFDWEIIAHRHLFGSPPSRSYTMARR